MRVGGRYRIRTYERFTVLCFSKALHSTALSIFLNFGGRSWIRTNALLRPDLQSGAIDHSAIPPYMVLKVRIELTTYRLQSDCSTY